MKLKKRISILIILVLSAALMLPACSSVTITPTAVPASSPSPLPTATLTPEPTPTPTPAPYHVGGPDIMGLYVNRSLLKAEYKTKWVTGKDIGIFYVYATKQETLQALPYKDQFLLFWKKFPNASEYRIAYELSFTLKSSEVVTLKIRKPKDCPKDPNAYFYQFIEVYVYDNVNRIPGPTFYHLEESSTNADTIMTSIKLTAGTKSSEVLSATLKAFIYNSDSEFDPVTGNYIGKLQSEVAVLKAE